MHFRDIIWTSPWKADRRARLEAEGQGGGWCGIHDTQLVSPRKPQCRFSWDRADLSFLLTQHSPPPAEDPTGVKESCPYFTDEEPEA